MNRTVLSLCVGASLALSAATAWADQKIDVGRLTAVFKETGWTGGADTPYNHELMSAQGTFRGKGKVLTLTSGDGQTLAVMYIGASYPQVNVYSQRGTCGTNAQLYIRDLNDSKLENRRCVYAGGPFESKSVLDGATRYLKDAAKGSAINLPAQAYFVNAAVTARGGYLIDVEVLLDAGFTGSAGAKAGGEVPASLRPSIAAWADQLGEASITALTSFSGNLVVPPVEFSSAAK